MSHTLEPRLWTVPQIAAYFSGEAARRKYPRRRLGRTTQYVRKLIRSGRLPGFRVGRDYVAFQDDVIDFVSLVGEDRYAPHHSD